jgi:regulation of enolase protein 1 (concanavalin A-like superfamily)
MSVSAAGADIWSSSDEFLYVHKALHGDGMIVARVDGVSATHPWAKAGVMIRESLDSRSRHAFMLVSPSQGAAFQWRSAHGGNSGSASGSRSSSGWIRLDRESSVITAYESPDGVTWTRVGSQTMSLPSTVYVGVAVTSHSTSALTEAVLSHVRVVSGGGSLPSGWSSQDVGRPAIEGAAAHAGGAFAVSGAGWDIWDGFDQFQFVYRRASGDVDMTARVSSLQAVHEWTKAGIMVRSTLDGISAHGSAFLTGSNGVAFQRRPLAGAHSFTTPGDGRAAPGWVKLERRGNSLSAYSSVDGVRWTFVGSDNVNLPETVYVGLAVTSHNVNAAATAVFDQVTVVAASGLQAPSQPEEPESAPAPSPSPSPRYLSFTPSSDHATNVNGYTLQIVKASAPSQVVAEQNLGKPSVSSGTCKVDITTLLAALPSGSYVAVVRAYNQHGSSSGATGSFTW